MHASQTAEELYGDAPTLHQRHSKSQEDMPARTKLPMQTIFHGYDATACMGARSIRSD